MKQYIKNIYCCYDCPNYYCLPPECGKCTISYQDYHGIKIKRFIDNPFTIQEWCPLHDAAENDVMTR